MHNVMCKTGWRRPTSSDELLRLDAGLCFCLFTYSTVQKWLIRVSAELLSHAGAQIICSSIFFPHSQRAVCPCVGVLTPVHIDTDTHSNTRTDTLNTCTHHLVTHRAFRITQVLGARFHPFYASTEHILN